MTTQYAKRRRLKIRPSVRSLVRENRITPDDLVYALSVDANLSESVEVETMPGIFRYSIEGAVEKARECAELGLKALYLIGVPVGRDPGAGDALSDNGVIPTTARRIKEALGDRLTLIGDSYLGYFTDHQIGGVLDDSGRILDGPTLDLVARIAVKWAQSGVDVFCNSTMVDGRVRAAREALDENGFDDVLIMSSIKFNSAFYLSGAGLTGTGESYSYDKGVYYIEPHNSIDPVKIAGLDVEQGVDMLNVKPATPYMDIIARLKAEYGLPTSAYSIAGDYSMIAFGSRYGNLDERDCVMELVTSIKRAGADMVITYWADRMARWLG